MNDSPHFITVLKKPYVFIPILLVLVVLTVFMVIASLRNPANVMQKPVGIKYSNSDLGFSMLLPESFEYFQTQRINADYYIDIEIFVPTTDRIYVQEVSGYGKAMVVRSYERSFWDGLDQNSEERAGFLYQGLVSNRAIAVKFWSSIPVDWENKWNTEAQDFILKNFKLD